MKIYSVTADWTERTTTGTVRPRTYADTHAEARTLARKMAADAAANPNLDPQPEYTATVCSILVSERFGKGRRFVVALLNGEDVLAPHEVGLYEATRQAAVVRCSACGTKYRAQTLNPTPSGPICAKCFEDCFPHEEGPRPGEAAPSPVYGLTPEAS